MSYFGPDGNFDDVYVTEQEIIDQYLGTELWATGNNDQGQLGTNTAYTVNRSSPVQSIGDYWKSIECGIQHACGIKSNGTIWCWGHNSDRNLGDGTSTTRSSPVQVFGGGNTWAQLTCGQDHSAAIKTDGTLWGWGLGNYGVFGNNNTTASSSPMAIFGGVNTWQQVSCGDTYTMAVRSDGTLWGCGSNSAGRLGDGTATHRSSPVQVFGGGTDWKQVACSTNTSWHTVAIKTDGTMWAWGKSGSGVLGINETGSDRSSPAQIPGTYWKSVSCGGLRSAAIRTDGTLWVWGYATGRPLGDGTSSANRSSPVQVFGGGTDWKQVKCGVGHTVAVKTDGTLWTWGDAYDGGLGNGSITDSTSPIQMVSLGTSWTAASAGASFTAAIKYSDHLIS